ncbi:hypothetical protein QEH59_02130 [Coraliomargarita sp. SDUM461004]|uniref:Uncharacterized protein n=1 Tax=Thalassobacterium sedimentorum TaxID=3041258 RepID=A0ABU1AEY4_9BACT|nr:hypothetical protein [Coraliomargarita sp. SDUM461004]MDQ8193207.1 hypothetical protein [Coraliomargarita sp. SDUM461004]
MPFLHLAIEFPRSTVQRGPIETNTSVHSPESQSRIVGSTVGRVRRLSGFQKHHHVPEAHSDAAQNFVRKAGHPDVKSAADTLYSDIRSLFGYRRREFNYSCEDGFAWIKTPDFDLQIKVDQCPEDPKNYTMTTEIVALHTQSIAADERLHHCFTYHCDQLIVDFASPIQVDDKIDILEDIPELAEALSYEPDGSAFELKLPKLDLLIQVDESSMAFKLLTLRDLGKLLHHSQKALDILASAQFGLRLQQ